MKLSRWVFLALCGLLCVVLVVPVRSGTDLVVNGDFLLGDALTIDGWVQETSQATRDFDEFPRVAPSLRSIFTSSSSQCFRYSQCVDTSGITTGVYVGGSIATGTVTAASIEVTLHTDALCQSEPLTDTVTLVAPAGDIDWYDLSTQLDMPDVGGAYVKISVNQTVDGEFVYFDDIFVQESVPTSVLVVQPSGRASAGLIAVAVLVGIAVAVAFLRRH